MIARDEIERGERFAFGENWKRFLSRLTPAAIGSAQASLKTWFGTDALSGRTFLDIGSGSGLFSLCARNLGARVVSFDFDPDSVACGETLRARERPGDPDWRIEQGSALDVPYLESLGRFDVVYAWGSLHHTGALWTAVDNSAARVASGGRLFLALYNDQGARSRIWTRIKRTYLSGLPGRILASSLAMPWFAWRGLTTDLLQANNPLRRYLGHDARGMSEVRDWIDWLGGYPFEVCTPGEVVEFLRQRGFVLEKLETTLGLGCNQFLFSRPG